MKLWLFTASQAQMLHMLFEWIGMGIGFQAYRWQLQRYHQKQALQKGSYAIIIGCIVGAAIGNKMIFWLEFPHLWRYFAQHPFAWLSGQSIVGGLLGGLLGVELAKKLTGQTSSTGDNFVLPLMIGTAIGRIGCFLAGLHDGTFGNPTTMPWGVDFGDDVARHPTQIYDMAFVLLLGTYLLRHRRRWHDKPGLLFKLYLTAYLLWRLMVDGLKPVPWAYGFGMSGIQMICLIALFFYLPLLLKQWRTPSVNISSSTNSNTSKASA